MKTSPASCDRRVRATPKKTKLGTDPRGLANVNHYLPISRESSQFGFYLTSLGCSAIPPGTPYPPVQHPKLYHFNWMEGRVLPEFSLMLITQGSGLFESKGTGMIPLSAGMGVLLFPGVWHRYRPDPNVGWTESWMHFDGKVAHLLLEQKIISPNQPIHRYSRIQELDAELQALIECSLSLPAVDPLLLSLRGLSVLNKALVDRSPESVVGESISPELDPLVVRALDYIWSRSSGVLSVSDVAQATGVTRRKLERHMLLARGCSVLDEIVNCRFNRAERLLRETDLPVKTVVWLSGFGSLQNMRFVFRRRRRITPNEYRGRSVPLETEPDPTRQ